MTRNEFFTVQEWLKNEEGGECADFRNAKNLDYAYIRLIDLNGAITK